MSKGGDAPVIGYNYFFGIHAGIGRGPVDELVKIKVGDREAWPLVTLAPNLDKIEPIEYEREYPAASVFHAPVVRDPDYVFSTYYVRIDIDAPEAFTQLLPDDSPLITFENLVRDPGALDMSGDYALVQVVRGATSFVPADEGGGGTYVETSSYLLVDVGNDPDDLDDWIAFASGTPVNDTPITIGIPDPNMGTEPGPVGSATATESTRIYINAPGLFGGQYKEGGVQGYADVMMGESTQLAPADLKTMLDEDQVPGFRGMFTVFFNGLIASLNPYPKPWKFRVRRALKGWDGDVWEPGLAVIPMKSPGNVGLRVLNDLAAPPGSPAEGDAYLVTTGTGAWDGKDNRIATWTSGAWVYTIPSEGNVIYNSDNELAYEYTGGQWEPLGQTSIHAMNPAHIVYECLTNRVWGRGLARNKIDEVQFREAAVILSDEGFGLCLKWLRRDSIESFVQSVLDHIGAAMYEDRTTAKMVLKLIRAVDIESLPLYDSSNGLIRITDNTVASSGKYVNELKVIYHDPITNQDRPAKVDNLASLQANAGAFVSIERSYPGIPTAELARRVAQRDLRSMGVELRRFTIEVDRRAWDVTPGSAIRIKDPVQGLRETVVRIVQYGDGTLKNGSITLKGVQDAFALPSDSFIKTQPPLANPAGGTSGASTAACVGRFETFEMPYALVQRVTTAEKFALIEDDDAFLGVVMDKSVTNNATYQLAVRTGLPEEEDAPENEDSFCGYEPIAADGIQYRLGGGGAYETAWYADVQDALDELMANYDAATAGTWVVATGYPVLGADGIAIRTKLSSAHAGGSDTNYSTRTATNTLQLATGFYDTKALACGAARQSAYDNNGGSGTWVADTSDPDVCSIRYGDGTLYFEAGYDTEIVAIPAGDYFSDEYTVERRIDPSALV